MGRGGERGRPLTFPEAPAADPGEAPPGGCTGRVARAGTWKLSGSILGYFVVFARTAVLARLLTPAYFGAFNLVLVVIAFADSFTRLGLETALVDRREVDREVLDLVWTLNVIRGFAMAGPFPIPFGSATHSLRQRQVLRGGRHQELSGSVEHPTDLRAAAAPADGGQVGATAPHHKEIFSISTCTTRPGIWPGPSIRSTVSTTTLDRGEALPYHFRWA